VRNPFIPTIEDGKIVGLGSNDAGASVVSLLHAFFYLTQQQQQYNFDFCSFRRRRNFGLKNGIESLFARTTKNRFCHSW